jgi:hypothetical protein
MQTLHGMKARRPRLVQGKINQETVLFFHYAVPRQFMQRKMRMGKT